MFKETVTICNATGLHARPASEFVQLAKSFESKVFIKRVTEEEPANAKSIVRLLSLGLEMGAEVEISAEGDDEEKAVKDLVALINTGFGE